MHHDRHVYRLSRGLPCFLLLAATLLTPLTATAQERRWRNPLPGAFQNPANWTGSVIPGPADPASFGLAAGTSPFSVSFSADAQNSALNILNQRPSFDLAGFTYSLSGPILIGGVNTPSLDIFGGVLQSNAHLFVAQGGPGSLSVLGGATARAANISVGSAAAGSLTVRGPGSRAESTGSHAEIGFGGSGSGSVLVDQGGVFSHGVFMHLGSGASGVGSLTVRDQSSQFISPFLHVGHAGGNGSLLVESGGAVVCSDHIDISRYSPNSIASMTTRGAGSSVATGSLSCTGGGRGDVLVEEGGRLDIVGETDQWSFGTRQSWTVQNAGSEITFGSVSGRLFWPEGDSSSIHVLDGGAIRGSEMAFGSHHDSHALDFEISGPESAVELTRGFYLDRGSADVRILDGARLTALDGLRMGCCAVDSTQSLLVRGADSELVVGDWPNTDGSLFVGVDSDDKSLVVDHGARLIVENNAFVGHRGQGSLNVNGPGSSYESPHRLHVGWGDANSHGSFSLTGGASAWLGSLWMSGGPASSAEATIADGSLMIVEHGGEVYQAAELEITSGGAIETSGYINLYGAIDRPARMSVTGPSSYHYGAGVAVGGNPGEGGPGILTLADGGMLFATGGIHVRKSGTLFGDGMIDGSIHTDGRIVVGNELGALACRNVYMAANSILSIQIGSVQAGSQHDVLVAQNDAALAGRLELSLANGFVPTVGQYFDILTAAPGRLSGAFNSISGLDLGNARAFAVEYLTDRVRLRADAVTYLDIVQDSRFVVEGFREGLIARATFGSNAPQDVTRSVAWSSDDPNIAAVGSDGMLIGISGGSTVVRARFAGFEDLIPVTVRSLPRLAGTQPGLLGTMRDPGLPEFDRLTPFMSAARDRIGLAGDEIVTTTGRASHVGARFTGTLVVPLSGDYTFACGADDVVSVSIDGQPVTFGRIFWSEQPGTVYLDAGEHAIQADYAQGCCAGSWMYLAWSGPNLPRQDIPSSAYAGGSVAVEYFDLPSGSLGPVVPNLDDYRIVRHSTEQAIDRPLYPGGYLAGRMLRFDGLVSIPDDAEYTLTLNVDDGAKVWLDGQLRVEAWSHFAFGTPHTFQATLARGVYPIRVDYTEHFGHYGGIELRILGPGISNQLVPPAAFSHGIASPCVPCDTNCNGTVNQFDIQPFIDTLISHTGCSPCAGDANGNGTVNQFDIFGFVDCLVP